LPQINRKLALVLDERAGVVSADVTSARVLADSSKDLIEENLRGITGRQVRVNFDIDENLIGGIVTRIGSTVYDGSIRTQLKELGKRLSGM
jgi:F-type H+-transporting ATPase subunit delta